jgi:hypothetical protein
LCASAQSAFSTSLKACSLALWFLLAVSCSGDGSAIADPAMLRILAQSERFRTRYDAAKREIPLVEVR